MKQLTKYILPLIMLLALVGCKSIVEQTPQEGEGEIEFKVKTDVRSQIVEIKTKSGEDPTYSLKIYKGSQTTPVQSFEDYTTMGRLRLQAGQYRFVVESGQDVEAEFDAPYYRGEQSVTISAGQRTPVLITASLANVRISSDVSQIIKDNFSDYSLTINGKTITKIDMLSDRSLYISAESDNFTWVLKLINNQGTESVFYQTVKEVEACSHYKFHFDIDQSLNPEDGTLMLELTVDTQVEHIDVDIDISLEQHEAPIMVPTSAFELDKQEIVNEIIRGRTFSIDLFAQAGIKELKIRHANVWLEEQLVPYLFEATNVGQTTQGNINAAGILWSQVLVGASNANINFTILASKAPLGEYKFYITLTDNDNQVTERVLNFVVLPDQDHITRSAVFGAKYAILNGEWCTLDKPAGLTFQYKIKGADNWTTLSESQIQEVGEKKFTARVVGLLPTTQYVFRTYSPEAGDKQGQEVEFTTFAAPEIPNLGFEQEYWSGSTWYPNASGGNSYWATGNEGMGGIVGQSSNNVVEKEDVVRGKAIRMTSVRINLGISPVKFAAGSLFTGQYSTDMSNPINSVKFGRAYTGRPLALKGWYKYKPVKINNNSYSGGVAGATGTMDKCHIYISLEHWGSATVRPSNPTIIGYGELKSDEVVTQYRQFEIPIQYLDANRIPTHVVLAATASHFGGLFCGGEGSELLVDEFELVWE